MPGRDGLRGKPASAPRLPGGSPAGANAAAMQLAAALSLATIGDGADGGADGASGDDQPRDGDSDNQDADPQANGDTSGSNPYLSNGSGAREQEPATGPPPTTGQQPQRQPQQPQPQHWQPIPRYPTPTGPFQPVAPFQPMGPQGLPTHGQQLPLQQPAPDGHATNGYGNPPANPMAPPGTDSHLTGTYDPATGVFTPDPPSVRIHRQRPASAPPTGRVDPSTGPSAPPLRRSPSPGAAGVGIANHAHGYGAGGQRPAATFRTTVVEPEPYGNPMLNYQDNWQRIYRSGYQGTGNTSAHAATPPRTWNPQPAGFGPYGNGDGMYSAGYDSSRCEVPRTHACTGLHQEHRFPLDASNHEEERFARDSGLLARLNGVRDGQQRDNSVPLCCEGMPRRSQTLFRVTARMDPTIATLQRLAYGTAGGTNRVSLLHERQLEVYEHLRVGRDRALLMLECQIWMRDMVERMRQLEHTDHDGMDQLAEMFCQCIDLSWGSFKIPDLYLAGIRTGVAAGSLEANLRAADRFKRTFCTPNASTALSPEERQFEQERRDMESKFEAKQESEDRRNHRYARRGHRGGSDITPEQRGRKEGRSAGGVRKPAAGGTQSTQPPAGRGRGGSTK